MAATPALSFTSCCASHLSSGPTTPTTTKGASLLHHPDSPWRQEEVWTTDKDGTPYLAAEAEALPAETVYPKEQRLCELAKAEKARGRRVLVFVQGTDKRDVTGRLKELLEAAGLRAAVLKSHTTSAENREVWVENRVKEGLDVLICHPRVVQTGLDLIAFPTLTYVQVERSVFTLRQATRRSWRIGQKRPVKVVHLAFQETAQVSMLGLIARKVQSSLALEGELVTGGLVDMAGDDSMLDLAKKLIRGETGVITDFSSVHDADDDFISEIETDDFKLWDLVGAGFTGEPQSSSRASTTQPPLPKLKTAPEPPTSSPNSSPLAVRQRRTPSSVMPKTAHLPEVGQIWSNQPALRTAP